MCCWLLCVENYYGCFAPLQSPLIANVAKNDVNGVRRYAGMPNRIKEKGKWSHIIINKQQLISAHFCGWNPWHPISRRICNQQLSSFQRAKVSKFFYLLYKILFFLTNGHKNVIYAISSNTAWIFPVAINNSSWHVAACHGFLCDDATLSLWEILHDCLFQWWA